MRGWIRYHVLFVIRLAIREVKIVGIILAPHDSWMKQIARNLTEGFDGFLEGYKYLIHDRLGWGWITAGMIVLCAAPVYVQLLVGGAAVHAGSATKGGLCLKANRSSSLSQTRPFAS